MSSCVRAKVEYRNGADSFQECRYKDVACHVFLVFNVMLCPKAAAGECVKLVSEFPGYFSPPFDQIVKSTPPRRKAMVCTIFLTSSTFSTYGTYKRPICIQARLLYETGRSASSKFLAQRYQYKDGVKPLEAERTRCIIVGAVDLS